MNTGLIILLYCNTTWVFEVRYHFRMFIRNSILLCQCLCVQRLMILNRIVLILWFQIKWWWFWFVLFPKSYLACIHIFEFIDSSFTMILFISLFQCLNSLFDNWLPSLRIIWNTLIHKIIWVFIIVTWWVNFSLCKFHLRLSNLASTISKLLCSLLFEELLKFLLFLEVIFEPVHLFLFKLVFLNKSTIFLLNWSNFIHVLLKMLW